MRALTHIHTTHSWDSRNSIERLVDRLAADDIQLALVSDHDDFAGSIDVRRVVAGRGLDIRVPVAAEIRTDLGDVIVIFERGDPPSVAELKRWSDLSRIVRERQGLIWLPHPFQSHREIEELAAGADIIETFNARCSTEQNRSAADLCARHGKVPAFGADIHRLTEIGRFAVDYPSLPSTLDTLCETPRCDHPVRTRKSDIMAAEIVNGIKRRRITLVGYHALKWAKHRSKEIAGRAPSRTGP